MTLMIKGHFVGEWRWTDRAGDPVFGELSKTFQSMLGVAGSVDERHASLTSNGQLTSAGVRAQMIDWVKGDAGASVARARVTVAGVRRKLKLKRDDLSVQGPDKTDVAGALLRQELRSYLRSLDPVKRTAMLVDPALDADVATAILEAPAVLSGVSDKQRLDLIDRSLHGLHSKEMVEIAEVEQAIEVVENSIRAASNELKSAIKVSDGDFDAMIAGTKFVRLRRETRRDESTGWLPKETIKVVDMERKILREATPAEIENGFFEGEGGGDGLLPQQNEGIAA